MPLPSYKTFHIYINFFCCSRDFTYGTLRVNNHQNPQRQGDRLSIGNSSSAPPPACKRDPDSRNSKIDTDISRWLADVHVFAKRIHRSLTTVCTVHGRSLAEETLAANMPACGKTIRIYMDIARRFLPPISNCARR